MEDIKVYKTNVDDYHRARDILELIRSRFPGSRPFFDLEDCDRVLKIIHPSKPVDETLIHTIFKNFGYHLEILP